MRLLLMTFELVQLFGSHCHEAIREAAWVWLFMQRRSCMLQHWRLLSLEQVRWHQLHCLST